jgi:integrase
MRYAAKDINKLIEHIRSGHPPELPEGTREQHYNDPALPGFYIRLLNTGVASWVVQWKRLGRQRKITLGNVLVLNRPEAVKAGRELLAKMTLGLLDPHEARREQLRLSKVTFETLTPLFLEEKKRNGDLKSSTAENWTRWLTGYYFQPLHRLPIVEITKDQIQTRIATIAIQSGPTAAGNCHMIMSVFFKWAIETDKLPDGHPDPMIKVRAPKQNGPRERVLNDDEIRLIWKACETWEAEAIDDQRLRTLTGKGRHGGLSGPITDYARGIMLLFLTGCRKQEIGGLEWAEVDLDNGELLIPGARIKNEEDLCNPLADWAVQILRGVERRPDRKHVFGHTEFPGQELDCANKKIDRRIAKAGGTPPKNWTIHDIRRTFRTRMAALGVTPDVGEALVGHVGHRKPIERIYNRHKYWAEKRQALAMWEANLRAIIDGTAEKIARPQFGEPKKGGANETDCRT